MINVKRTKRALATSLAIVTPLVLSSGCADDGQNHHARNAGIGIGALTFLGNVAAGNNLISSAINGSLAGFTTYEVVSFYDATVYQRRVAYDRGERAIRREPIRRTIQSSGSRVVAVKVPKPAGRPSRGTSVMLVSSTTGKPVSGKAYELQSQPRDGGTVTIAGNAAVFSSSEVGY